MTHEPRVHGTRAIRLHQQFGWSLYRSATATDSEQKGISVEEAEDIVQDEPMGVFVDVPPDAAYSVSGDFDSQDLEPQGSKKSVQKRTGNAQP